MYSRNLFVLDFVRRFFVSCAQIFEAYVVRTVMKLGATGGKSATKAGTGKTPKGHIILACYILPTWHDITEMLKKQLKNISQALLVLLFIMFQPVQLHGNLHQGPVIMV